MKATTVKESPNSPRLRLLEEANVLLQAGGLLSLQHLAALAGKGDYSVKRELDWVGIRPVGRNRRGLRYTVASWRRYIAPGTQRRLDKKREEYNAQLRPYFAAKQREHRARTKGVRL